MRAPTALVWFRNDLRLDDHGPLMAALNAGYAPLPAFVWPAWWQRTLPIGLPAMGPYRHSLVLEALADLRANLQTRGSDLVLRQGTPAQALAELAQQCGAQVLFYGDEPAPYERQDARRVAQALEAAGLAVHPVWHQTLYHLDDLPFSPDLLPEPFTAFRKKVEARALIRKPQDAPASLPPLPQGLDPGQLAALPQPASRPPADPRRVFAWKGGETPALAHLQQYVWPGQALRRYKETRNASMGAANSTKLSPWLALGCLSPRRVHEEIRRHEREHGKNDSTYWVIFELLWRDYFKFLANQTGAAIFRPGGTKGVELPLARNRPAFEAWRTGQTAVPLADAHLRELAATGYLSNRGRQIVGSVLTKNLNVDWTWGAQWFEHALLDYDPCSNWGNWTYVAGVGTDPRGFRYFHPVGQAKKYDPEAMHIKHWVPELANLPAPAAIAPWTLPPAERDALPYPQPLVDLDTAAEASERQYVDTLNRHGHKTRFNIFLPGRQR